jgi:hypothetical protein
MTERRATAITNNKARELKRFLRRRHRPEVERRLQAVLSVLWGHRTADVATRYDVTDRAVRQWVQRFNISGPSALMRSRGRKPRWTKAQREELRRCCVCHRMALCPATQKCPPKNTGPLPQLAKTSRGRWGVRSCGGHTTAYMLSHASKTSGETRRNHTVSVTQYRFS